MKIISYLHLLIHLLSSYPYSVVEGTVYTYNAADGDTCTSGADADDDADADADSRTLCFPDGACFESLNEAETYYKPQQVSSTTVSSIAMKVPKPFGKGQEVGSPDSRSLETLEVLANTYEYMVDLFQNDTAKSFRDECQMRHELCAFWAVTGECEAVS
jgi:hypothetical protein